MSFSHWVAVAMLSASPLAAFAGQPTLPDPVDARASGAPFTYESAFTSYRAAPEEQASPDTSWRAANDMVGTLGGHAGHSAQGNNGNARAPNPASEAANPMPMRQGHGVHQGEAGQQ